MNFQNTNYQQKEEIRSAIGEWNATFGNSMANSFIIGYTKQNEDRATRGTGELFPLVDILDAGTTYTSFGYEPFTPRNQLKYDTFQVQNNFTKFANKHTMTFGATAERYDSTNVFFPGSQSAYVYNSLADFYTDANDYLRNPNRTVSPVSAAPLPGALEQHPRAGRAGPAAGSALRGRVRAGRVGGARQPEDHGRHPPRRAELRRHGLRQRQRRCAHLPLGGRVAGAVLDGQAARRQHPVVAARRLQLGAGRESHHAGAWRHGRLHGPAGLRVDLEPDRQHGRADGLRAAADNTFARPFNPNPDAYKPSNVTGAPASQLRAGADRSRLQVPAALAHQLRGGPAAVLGHDRHRGVHLQPRRQRRVLHQRQPAGRADAPSPAPTPGPATRPTASTRTSPTRWC